MSHQALRNQNKMKNRQSKLSPPLRYKEIGQEEVRLQHSPEIYRRGINQGTGRMKRARNLEEISGLAGTFEDNYLRPAKNLRKKAIVVMRITVDLD